MSLCGTFASGIRKLAGRYGCLQGASLKRDRHVHRRLLRIEPLEVRVLLSTYTVTNTADSGIGSLRQAITDANTNAGLDTIAFSIAGAGVHTIAPATALPFINGATIIDATTQPGYAGTPLIEINGTGTGGTALKLYTTSGGSTIKGLTINRCGNYGVWIQSDGNTISNNWVGLDNTGSVASANRYGIYISSSTNNIVHNVLSGNTAGVYFGNIANGNTIAGNFIGTDPTGMSAIGNGYGVRISSGTGNIIGGTTAADRNIISGNSNHAIYISSASNTIIGNYVGTDYTGTAAIPNTGGYGIYISAANNNVIGDPNAGNVVSAGVAGIMIANSDGTIIQGNYVGLNAAGTAALSNSDRGIYLKNSTNTLIGGTDAADRNVISGNLNHGIHINSSSNNNTVEGNYIGTDYTGNVAIGNVGSTLCVDASSNNNVIGAPGAGNVIAAGSDQGIRLDGVSGTVVQGNSIGVGANGTTPLGNTGDAVWLQNATNTTIGGTSTGTGNIIANSKFGTVGHNGVEIIGTSSGVAILHNSIYGNAGLGIDLGSDGVTANNGTKNSGLPNYGMDFPVIIYARLNGTSLTLNGYVGSATNQSTFANAIVEFFQSDNSPSGYGQGRRYLGCLTTDANGNFNGTLTVSGIAKGDKITATATDAGNNTSEFGPNIVTAGITITPVSGLTTTETGGTVQFTVVLDSQPTADVIIGISSSDITEGTVNVPSLTFTSANWNLAQSVTVTGMDDLVADGDIAYSIITASAASADLNYNGLDASDVSLTNIDNDTTTIVATDHPAGSIYGQTICLTATVSASLGAGTATGTVQFQIDGSNFGSTVLLHDGMASIAVNSLRANSHSVTATYASDNAPTFQNSQTDSPVEADVTPASLTITADNKTKLYGAALPTLTASYTGFVNSDTAANLTTQAALSTTATAASHVSGNPYTITASGAVDADYTISYVSGTLSVTPASLTITADNKTKLYGAALPTLTASYTGFVNGDTAANLTTQAALSTTATAASHVSGNPYTITASGAVDADYTISYVSGTLSVTPASLTITADNKTKLYGAALPTLTASYTGFVNGDTAANLTTQAALSTTATAASHVSGNPYTITASGAVDADYTISYVSGTLNVTPASLTITADNKTKLYGAALPTLTASYTGFVNSDTAANLTTQAALSTTATAASHVSGNPYTITASGAVDADYTISYVSGTLSVTPASLTITADNKTKLYGAALPTLTASYTGFVNSDTAANLTTQAALSTTATAASHVSGNPYTITASGAVDADYTISYVSGTLSVTPASLTITADNKTKLYGAALPTLTASYTGFVNGDTAANLTTQAALSTAATAASHVSGNPYTITASGAVDADYTISYVSGTLNVTPASLTITADNKTKLYGAALPTLTASYTGFVNGDTAANLTTQAALSTTATAASHVSGNPYTITASGAVDADYTISYVSGTLSVTPASLTITADNKTKLYGAALPTLTASYTGFVNGDTAANLTTQAALSTAATAASHVSGNPYTITASGAVDADYTISYVSGTLNVTPASLTITADNKTKLYGAALPTLTASYTGFVNGDTAANLTTQAALSTTATAASPINNYPITVRGASSPDYTIQFLSGTLTVYPTQNATFLMPDPINTTKQTLYVFGTSANDLILINPGFASGYVTVSMNGKSLGTFKPTSRIIAHGLAGNDYIGISKLIAMPSWLYGDDGNDVLWGGGGPNIMMGGAGKDNLYGGMGRSLLIGGADSDTLAGGIGDALLIGKNTNFDANDAALLALMNEWNSAANYATRAGHITGKSGGLNGSCFLNATTIRNDIYKDTMIGSSAMDLYFRGFCDIVGKKKILETLITLNR